MSENEIIEWMLCNIVVLISSYFSRLTPVILQASKFFVKFCKKKKGAGAAVWFYHLKSVLFLPFLNLFRQWTR